MSETITDRYQRYLVENWPINPDLKLLAVMGLGMCGEAGEASEHFKKVLRDYDCDFAAYPEEKRMEALLEFGDALHYLLKCADQFGFMLEDIMTTNMDKLDKRYGRIPWYTAL